MPPETGSETENPISNVQLRGPATIQMRCPKCQKLYSVQTSLLKEASGELQFSCIACESRFVTPALNAEQLNEKIRSEFVDTLEIGLRERVPAERAPVSELRCPKCRSRNALSAKECTSCGIIFEKYQPSKLRDQSFEGDINFTGRPELAELWNQVLANYDQISLHEKFVQECYRFECLPFASRKYAQILSSAPTEDIARSMRKRIIGLASFRAEVARESGGWSFRVPGMNGMVIVFGSALMTIGLVLPMMKDLAGVGFSAILLGVGVRYFLRAQA